MVGNNAICYQGIQRVFRNAIVGFLRQHLPRIFPKDHVQQMKKPFGEAWDKAATDAARSRVIGGTSTALRDDYDLLGVNHFFEVFDKNFDKLFSAAASSLPALADIAQVESLMLQGLAPNARRIS